MSHAQENLNNCIAVIKPQRGTEIFCIKSHVIAGIRTKKSIRRRRIAAIQILCPVVFLRQRQKLHLRVYREWDALAAQYRGALTELTSPRTWARTFGVDQD